MGAQDRGPAVQEVLADLEEQALQAPDLRGRMGVRTGDGLRPEAPRLLQVRPHYTFARLAQEHLQLVDDLEREGPEVLRLHLRAAAGSVVDGVLRDG